MFIHSRTHWIKLLSSKVKPGWDAKCNSLQWPFSVVLFLGPLWKTEDQVWVPVLHSPHCYYSCSPTPPELVYNQSTQDAPSAPCHKLPLWQASIFCLKYFWHINLGKNKYMEHKLDCYWYTIEGSGKKKQKQTVQLLSTVCKTILFQRGKSEQHGKGLVISPRSCRPLCCCCCIKSKRLTFSAELKY